MKRIGILTYHRSVNYGAFMQAYSLSERLAEDFPDYRVEIIDYMSESAYRYYHPRFMQLVSEAAGQKSLRGKLGRLRRAFAYISAGQGREKLAGIFEEQLSRLRLSEEYILTDDEKLVFEKLRGRYSAVIVGSDAVFNWQIRKFPNPYFLGEDIGALKLSFAASSYGQEHTSLTEEQKKYIAAALGSFDYIGVRDAAAEEFVRYADSSLRPVHNCDPTVFLDMGKLPVTDSEISEILRSRGVRTDRPIIGIMGRDSLGKLVRRIYGREYQVVAVFKENKYADIFLDGLTPFQWARVFGFFSVTFTHYFHGNLLSLKNGTPTVVVEERSGYNSAHDSKIRDLMKRLGLSGWCFYSGAPQQMADIKKLADDMTARRGEYAGLIAAALEKEAESYGDFRRSLSSLLEKNGREQDIRP